MVPGLFNRAETFFAPLIKHLNINNKYRVLPWSLPGRERKINETPLATLGEMDLAKDLAFLREQMKYKPKAGENIIIGHSRGALLALLLAKESNFSQIILLCPALCREFKAVTLINLKNFFFLLKQPAFWKKPVKRGFRATAKTVLPAQMPKEEKIALYNNLVWESGRAIWEIGLKPPLGKDIKLPVYPFGPKIHILAGEQDRLIPLEKAKLLGYWLSAEFKSYQAPHYLFCGPDKKIIFEKIKNLCAEK